jgi:tRNA A-37 threonylcarbamoyl transferase component Bud32
VSREVPTTRAAEPTGAISPEATPAGIDVARQRRKRRRPSGEPPPLPRKLESTGRYWLSLAVVVLAAWASVVLIEDVGLASTRVDLAILRGLESVRTPVLTDLALAFEFIGADLALRFVRWGALLALVFFRRFRHLFVFFGSILAVGGVTTLAAALIARPRPFGIDMLISWEGPSHPARLVAALAVTLVGILYSLVTPGRARTIGKWAAAASLALFSLARLYLGVDHLSDVYVGIIIGVAVPLTAFRLLTPNEIFPVRYKRGRAAHLDVSGARGRAIHKAVEDQLGLTVLDMAPFGLGGSGGSTPLRLRVEGEPHEYLFAKLYAHNHLRADRWYKLGRTLLYGRLEDEAAFHTVRRLVQYEDYLLRVMEDAGLNVPHTYGVVEITPEREYLLVTSFIDGAQELLDAEVTDAVIDDGLRMVRALWDAGVAHRDIKPSNVLVRDERVYLIDVAFGEVRPSPWRQAVDLANMMLVLAFRTSPEHVYARAVEVFTPDEIAEAFAATHSVTMPSQSRNIMKKEHENLLARFRDLAPRRRPMAIQRWSWRRAGLTLTVLVAAAIAFGITVGSLGGFGLVTAPRVPIISGPDCETSDQLLLMAQSVPTASQLPCLDALPPGWVFDTLRVRDGSSQFQLAYGTTEAPSVTVRLQRRCDTSGASEVPSDEDGTRRFESVRVVGDNYAGKRVYLFDGGCTVYDFSFFGPRGGTLTSELALGVSFYSRDALAENLRARAGLSL